MILFFCLLFRFDYMEVKKLKIFRKMFIIVIFYGWMIGVILISILYVIILNKNDIIL